MIQKVNAEHWIEWLEGLDKSSVWQASKLVMSQATDAGKSRILTLKIKDPVTKQVIREATDNMAKGQLFYKTFFPPRNPSTTPVLQDFQYPPPRWKFQNILDDQIHCMIKKMKPYKAMKNGSVPNSILIHAREDLIPHLAPLFHAMNMLNFYTQEWALTEILVLKKPGKPDYTSPNAW
jgi:hypothetical protein